MTDLTQAEIARALPPQLRTAATPALVAKVNAISNDPVLLDHIRDNFISYTHVLKDGKYKIDDYLSAVKYVSFKLMNMSNQDAYAKTFPQRIATLTQAGRTPKEISAYVSMYSKGKLVNALMEQVIIPTWVLNQDKLQDAINVQADLMVNAQSEMVRTTAANSLMTHLARPKEAAGININVNQTNENSALDELRELLSGMSQVSRDLISQGVDIKAVAAQRLTIDHEG